MNASPAPCLRIVVLAAGFSARLGVPKALVRVHGMSLLRGTIQMAARLKAGRIIVVVPRSAPRYRAEARGTKAAFAVNSQRVRGLSSSVRRGIAAARYSRAALLLPVDLAHLDSRELSRLVSRWRPAPRKVVARRIGQSGATPLILPRRLFSKTLSIAGDVGLREFVSRLPPEELVLVEVPSAALDVDTSEDLKIARRRLRRR
jgi:molybdenum cofactor cytidylyltransferase